MVELSAFDFQLLAFSFRLRLKAFGFQLFGFPLSAFNFLLSASPLSPTCQLPVCHCANTPFIVILQE
jgi:hypothetical protein